MSHLRYDIRAKASPTGTVLASFDDSEVLIGTKASFKLHGTGSIMIVVHDNQPNVTPTVFAKGNHVTVVDLDLGAGESICGGWLNQGDFEAVSQKEKSGRVLSFGGPGDLAYLAEAVMDVVPYVSGGGVYNGPRDDMLWHWGPINTIGSVIKRVLDELLHANRPRHPVAALTYNFTGDTDSASQSWDFFTGGFTLRALRNVLDCFTDFIRLGVTVLMKPTLQLNAFQNQYGTDRSNASFATGKVRFVGGVNVAGTLKRPIHESEQLKQILVEGDGAIPSTVVRVTDAGAAIEREGSMRYSPLAANAAASLTDAGERDLAARKAKTDTAVFPIAHGNDQLNGRYRPGWPGGAGHFWVGDTVRLHTGTGVQDFNEVNIRVAAISWVKREGGGQDIVLELGASYAGGAGGSAGGGAGGGCACPTPPSPPYNVGSAALLLPRLYFGATNLGTTPARHAEWDLGASVIRELKTTADGFYGQDNTAGGTPLEDTCGGRGKYVLTGTVVFTGGFVRAQTRARSRSGIGVGPQDRQSQMVVRLFDSTNALKATLLSPHTPSALDSAVWSNEGDGGPSPPLRNAMFPADSRWTSALGAPLAGTVTGVSGDYLLVEIGSRFFSGSGGIGHHVDNMSNQGSNDLPANDQSQTSAANSWIEFWNAGGDSFAGDDPPPAANDQVGSIGADVGCYALCDHKHPAQIAGVTPITDEGEFFTGTEVESALQELAARAWKQPVRAATSAAGTLASSFENGDTIDGVVLATDDRILIKDQAAGAENGIYVVNASGAPTRATDLDGAGEAEGAAVYVRDGTTNGDKIFSCTNNGTITIGTTALVFVAISGGEHSHVAGDSSKASATSDLTATTTTAADVTGATLSLAAGTYIVIGNFDVSIKSNTDRLFEGILDVGGTDENDLAVLQGVGLDTDDRQQVVQTWRIVLASTTTVKLQARHSGGSAGDFAVNAANTTLTTFTAGGTNGYPEGSSFPAGQTAGRKFYRTDRNLLYFDNGTRWLTVALYLDNMGDSGEFTMPSDGTGRVLKRWLPATQDYDVWLEAVHWWTFPATTNNGTNYHTVTLERVDSAGSATTIRAIDTSADTVDARRRQKTTEDELLGTGTYDVQARQTQTGNPGPLYLQIMLAYRYVG